MGRQEVGLGGGRGAGQGHCSPSVGRGQDLPVNGTLLSLSSDMDRIKHHLCAKFLSPEHLPLPDGDPSRRHRSQCAATLIPTGKYHGFFFLFRSFSHTAS